MKKEWGLYLHGQLMEKFHTAKEAHEALTI